LQGSFPYPLLRVDIANMTRYVHHHFDYRKDGHTRTYTMHVEIDPEASSRAREVLGRPQLSQQRFHDGMLFKDDDDSLSPQASWSLGLGEHVTSDRVIKVFLTRDTDGHFIPYTTVHGVTLIAIMRLGLLPALRHRAYQSFLSLPLYEDMAPWNLVFRGPVLDYIDYDTKDKTFDSVVPQAYQVLSVLMNYKRSVQDFEKCSKTQAKTPYGFPFLSDCVDSKTFRGPCTDPAKPVPCGDGECRSDYIDCLRALLQNGPAMGEKSRVEEEEQQHPLALPSPDDLDGEEAAFWGN